MSDRNAPPPEVVERLRQVLLDGLRRKHPDRVYELVHRDEPDDDVPQPDDADA